MDRESLAWAAGLFEGEGSISFNIRTRIRGGKEVTDYALQLSITQRDLWPLEKFVAALGVGRIYGPYRSEMLHYTANRLEEIQHIGACLWPWLSPRRKEKFSRCLTEYNSSGKIQYRVRFNGRTRTP